LLVRAVGDQRRARHPDALREDSRGDIEAGQFLVEDHLLHDGAAAQTVEGRCGKGLDRRTLRVAANCLFLRSQLSLELDDERAHDTVGLVRVCDISQSGESLAQRANQMQGAHDAQSMCWPFALAIGSLPGMR